MEGREGGRKEEEKEEQEDGGSFLKGKVFLTSGRGGAKNIFGQADCRLNYSPSVIIYFDAGFGQIMRSPS